MGSIAPAEHGSMKGQVVVFENVLIFSISVLLFTFSFMIFLNFQEYYRNVAVHDQLNKLGNMVLTGIITVAADEATNSSVTLSIPKTIASEHYEIRLEDGELRLRLKDVEKVSKAFHMGSSGGAYTLGGRVPSSKGKVTIYKNGGQINIL